MNKLVFFICVFTCSKFIQAQVSITADSSILKAEKHRTLRPTKAYKIQLGFYLYKSEAEQAIKTIDSKLEPHLYFDDPNWRIYSKIYVSRDEAYGIVNSLKTKLTHVKLEAVYIYP